MAQIRIIAAATVAVVFALSLQPAAARSDENAPAPNAAPQIAATQTTALVQLDNFMKTWKPVTASKRVKKSKSKTAAKPAPQQAATEPAPTEAVPVESVAKTVAPPKQEIETTGVAVTSFDEINELDAAANQVQVVAFNEVNDIDLAAPPAPAPVPVETTGQAAVSSQHPAPADKSWIGKLLLAAAGTIAIAGATRFLVSA